MRKLILVLLLLLSFPIEGKSQREISATTDIISFRPVGNMRVWTFVVKDSTIGQLFSIIKDEVKFAGRSAIEIQVDLHLDYNKIGTAREIRTQGGHFITRQGEYLGSKLEIVVNGQLEKLELKRDGGTIKGFMTRLGNEIDQETVLSSRMFAADRQFIDQLEILLATKNIKVGERILDSVFVPQTMYTEKVSAFVDRFDLISLYNEVKDSAFVILFNQPQEMVVYFSPDKRLLKVELPTQNTKIYLDVVRTIPKELFTKQSLTFNQFLSLLPLYAIYALVALLGLSFFAGRSLNWPGLYIAIGFGVLGFIVSAYTQVPLQEYFAKEFFFPKIESGESLYLWGLVPALPAGIIQETIKLFLIMAAIKFIFLTERRTLVAGAAIGAGFALLESCYIASKIQSLELFSFGLLEKSFLILLHIGSGVILARALNSKSGKDGLILFLIVILANSWLRYLPIFVQQGVVKAEALYLIQPLVPIIILLVAISQLKAANTGRI